MTIVDRSNNAGKWYESRPQPTDNLLECEHQHLLLEFGTLHRCPKCGAEYRCEVDECAVDYEWRCNSCIGQFWTLGHYFQTANRCKRDPIYAAKIERIIARQRETSAPLTVLCSSSPRDLSALDEGGAQ